MNKYRVSLIALAASILLLGVAGCTPAPADQSVPELLEPVGAALESVRVERGRIEDAAIYDGSVIPSVEELSFSIDGRITKVHRFLGDPVSQGDVILEIESIDRAEIEAKEAELAQLEAAWAHEKLILTAQTKLASLDVERLAATGADTGARQQQAMTLELRKLELKQAEERYELRVRQLTEQLDEMSVSAEHLMLTAPIDGRIVYLPAMVEGDSIRAYDVVLALADERSPVVRSAFVSDYTLGLADRIVTTIDGNDYLLVPHEMDWQTYMTLVLNDETPYTYYDIVQEAGDPAIPIGSYVPVRLVSREIDDCLRLPVNAVYRDGRQRYVYVIEDGNRVRREVEVGLSNPAWIEIMSGLVVGEEVYIHD